MHGREQTRDQQKNRVLGSALPQAMPGGGDTGSWQKQADWGELKDRQESLLRTSDEG